MQGGAYRLYAVRSLKTGKVVRVGMTFVTPIHKTPYVGKKLWFHGNYFDPPLDIRYGEDAELVEGDKIEINEKHQ